jgi:uroporphyrinogen-III synthase
MLIVTRPAAQAASWLERLRDMGVSAVSLPLIDIAPLADAQAQAALRECAQAVQGWRLAIFVSANAVEHFFAARVPGSAVKASEPGTDWPPRTWAGCTGEGTRAALRKAGVPEPCIRAPAAGATMDSEALWHELHAHDWSGERVLVVRGEEGRDWLGEQLRARGALVQAVAAYRRCLPNWDAAQQALMAAANAAPREHVWLFSSSEAVRNLVRLAPARAAAWHESAAIATHERIGEAARRAGFVHVRVVAPAVAEVAEAYRACLVEQVPEQVIDPVTNVVPDK